MFLITEYKLFRHKLSGIALIVDNKICIVLPKKYKREKKYSIPKGHIETKDSYYNARMELKEETGIDVGNRDFDSRFLYRYRKNDTIKTVEVFVIKMTKDEFENLEVGEHDTNEIVDVRFVKKKKAIELSENHFRELIKHAFRL